MLVDATTQNTGEYDMVTDDKWFQNHKTKKKYILSLNNIYIYLFHGDGRAVFFFFLSLLQDGHGWFGNVRSFGLDNLVNDTVFDSFFGRPVVSREGPI